MRQVVWGVLGTAGILRCTAAGMQKAELCNMYAIAGRNPKKTEEFKERYGFEKTYYSYDELLDDDKIEAVYIPLRELHRQLNYRASDYGASLRIFSGASITPLLLPFGLHSYFCNNYIT